MTPVEGAQAAVPLIERTGVIGAVVVCACVCVFGLAASVVVLWRAWDSERKKRQDEQAAHYKWALDQVVLHSERERRMGELLASIDAGVKGLEGFMRATVGIRT